MKRAHSKQEVLRIEKTAQLRKLGINPYPASGFPVNTTTREIAQNYLLDPASCVDIHLAGRLMSRRVMGSAAFAELQDHTGKIQLYLKKDTLCPGEDKTLYATIFKKLLDIGDIIGIKGYAFTTKTNHLAIHVTELTLLTKAIKPLPVVKEVSKKEGNKRYYTFSNVEHRYRQRYLDLLLNPEVRIIFEKRAKMIHTMRAHFMKQGYLEVETPILQPVYGGALARPFTTHHNTLDMPLYLRISNELYLKRLLVGGYPGVYEFAKDFRNEGMSRFHNPEFTMLEFYVAYRDYRWGMEQTTMLIQRIAQTLHGTMKVVVGEHTIDFGGDWKRFTMYEAIEHFTSINIAGMNKQDLHTVTHKLGIPVDEGAGKGKIIDEIFSSKCEPNLIQPTFITDYPIEMSPLAKQHRDDPELVERFELICNGKEICNAYSELNDPMEQRKRFEDQQLLGGKGDEETMIPDEAFIQALTYGMPPTVGVGIGIDRLTMIMTNSSSIQEVILFPQMRKEECPDITTFFIS